MKSLINAMIGIVGIASLLVLSLMLTNYLGFTHYQYVAPEVTQAKNEAIQESHKNMVDSLEAKKNEYLAANVNQKSALKLDVLYFFKQYPIDSLPPDLRKFYDAIKSGK